MIVLDIETTGTDFIKNSLISIGALDFSNPSNQFYAECRIFEGAEITEFALALNGFTTDQILSTNKYSILEGVTNYIKWASNIKEKTIVGENPRFDRDFLNAAFERNGLKRIPIRTIDLHTLSYISHLINGIEVPMKDGFSDLNLDLTLNYVGLPAEPKPHNALTGAKYEAEAFSRIVYGKNLLDEFKQFPIPEYLIK